MSRKDGSLIPRLLWRKKKEEERTGQWRRAGYSPRKEMDRGTD